MIKEKAPAAKNVPPPAPAVEAPAATNEPPPAPAVEGARQANRNKSTPAVEYGVCLDVDTTPNGDLASHPIPLLGLDDKIDGRAFQEQGL
ncbi:hypothetical protein CYMTET_30365, partial [Cymbomonas tetramitiformis]